MYTALQKKTALVLLLGSCIVSFFIAPLFVHAQTPDPKDTGITYDCAVENPGRLQGECNFYDLIRAVQKVMGIAIKYALAFSVVILAIAGWRYMTSGGNPGKIQIANKMFQSVAIGIVLILASWLIVNLIVKTLVKDVITDSPSFPIKK